eukprot:GILK01004081.1.p1 GENE.GILK01004081.1~~GILK01004081.1.p1  ORF type:complete len:816 (-),score=109.19 GILK01004081.1:45-2492(-)
MERARRWERVETTGEIYSPRTGHAVVVHGNDFYLFGGTDGTARQNDLHKFSPDTRVWHKIETNGEPPAARSGAKAVAFADALYIFGGYTKKDGEYFNDVFKFSIGTRTWSPVATQGEAPSPRTDHSCIVQNRSMLVFGGYDGRNRFNDLRELRLDTNRWTQINGRGHTPNSRFGHTCVLYESCLFIFGGWDGHDTLADLYEFSPSNTMWFCLPNRGSVPAPRYRHSAVVSGHSMFVFGGVDKSQIRFSDLNEFDFETRTWARVNTTGTSPSSRTFHKAVLHDGYMYVMGGFDGRRRNDMYRIHWGEDQAVHRRTGSATDTEPTSSIADEEMSTREEPLNVTGLNLMDSIGQGSNATSAMDQDRDDSEENQSWRWSPVRSSGQVYTPRTGHAVVVWENTFLLFGGTDEQARQNDIFEFNIDSGQWSLLEAWGSPPSARSGAKAVVYQENVFFFGGYTKKDGEYFNDLFKYNIRTRNWSVVTMFGEPPCERTDHTAVLHEDALLVFGGYDGRTRFNDLREFKLDSSRWVHVQGNGTLPITRFGHTAVVYGSSMFIFGGWDGHDTLDDLFEYSIVSQTWYPVPGRGQLATPRYRHSAVVFGSSMLVFGGVDKSQLRFNDLHLFNFDTRSWSRVNTAGTPPTSRTFHKAVVYGNWMYVLGGFDGRRRNDMYRILLGESLDTGRLRAPAGRGVSIRNITRGSQGELVFGSPVATSSIAQPHTPVDHVLSQISPSIHPSLASPSSTPYKEQSLLQEQVFELSKKLTMEMERDVCKVCFEREIDTVLLECCHRVVCHRCSGHLHQCPVCRLDIVRVLRTYNA